MTESQNLDYRPSYQNIPSHNGNRTKYYKKTTSRNILCRKNDTNPRGWYKTVPQQTSSRLAARKTIASYSRLNNLIRRVRQAKTTGRYRSAVSETPRAALSAFCRLKRFIGTNKNTESIVFVAGRQLGCLVRLASRSF